MNEQNYTVPEPFLFNPLKHHAGYIVRLTTRIDVSSETGRNELSFCLNVIGRSQMDLYCGSLSPFGIAAEIREYLEKNELLEEREYNRWLLGGKTRYRCVSIKDDSRWVLLPGKMPRRWVHIHPARYSIHTLRVRSETLKTAIAVISWCRKHPCGQYNLEVVNRVRAEILGLSPVKEVSSSRGAGKIIRLLSSFNSE